MQAISHYQILEALGKGGMGEVYKAIDTRLQRTLAIKLLPAEFAANERRKRRLITEAKAASALNHPNICVIYEIDEVDNTLFIAMEYVEGKTLQQEIAQGPVPAAKVLDIAIQVAGALEKTHRRGIVHRDIKPSNMIISDEGHVKILDFGLARVMNRPSEETPSEATTGDAPVTEVGTIAGTVAYMSPEQICGKEVDGRSDMFSFAVMLYEMLTKRAPFQGETVFEIASSILKDDPQPLSGVNPRVPPAFDAIIRRALAKDPAQRYVSMHEMQAELKKLRSESVSGSGVLRFRPTFMIRGRHIGVLAAVLLSIAFLLPQTRSELKGLFLREMIPSKKYLAVLPFVNISDEPSSQAFCEGLVETLTSKLTELEDFQGSLWVIPASEVRKSGATTAEQAARTFGVNLVITGSLQRSRDEIRLTANLVDTKTLRQLRALTMNAQIGDVFLLQDGVVRQIADILELELKPQTEKTLSAGNTKDPSAYDFYLQARGYLQRYEKVENIDTAIALFEQALAQDQKYALAYSGLAEAYWRKYDFTRDTSWVNIAEQRCKKALELNDQLAVVHTTLGVIFTGKGRHEEAVREFQRSLELHPRNSETYRELATAYEGLGKPELAEATYKKAIELWPASWVGYNRLGVFYYQHGIYNEAEKNFRRVIDLTPDNVRGYYNLGGLYLLMDRYEDAARMLEKSLTLQQTADAYTNLGTLYFFLGKYKDAVPLMEKATQLARNEYKLWGNLGDAYRWAEGLAEKAPATYAQAIELAEKQLAVNPNDADVRSSLAVYLAKLNEKKKAVEQIERALDLSADNVNVLFKSAMVFELCGHRSRALQQLAAALAAGYSRKEIEQEPELSQLRADPRFGRIITDGSTGSN